MTTMTAECIQITLQRLAGPGEQMRVRVLDQGDGAASGRSVCMTAEEAARMVGQIYTEGRERGARISLEVAPDETFGFATASGYPRPTGPSRLPVTPRLTRQHRRMRLF